MKYLPLLSMFKKEKAKALLELLQYVHAETYAGTDDSLSDNCDNWIETLTDEEVTKEVLAVFHRGI